MFVTNTSRPAETQRNGVSATVARNTGEGSRFTLRTTIPWCAESIPCELVNSRTKYPGKAINHSLASGYVALGSPTRRGSRLTHGTPRHSFHCSKPDRATLKG